MAASVYYRGLRLFLPPSGRLHRSGEGVNVVSFIPSGRVIFQTVAYIFAGGGRQRRLTGRTPASIE